MYSNNFENEMTLYPNVNNIVIPVGFNTMPYNGLNYPYQQNDIVLTQEEQDDKNLKDLEKQEKIFKKRQIFEQRAWEVEQMKYSREQREISSDNIKIDAHYKDESYLNNLGISLGKQALEDKYVVKIRNDKPIIDSKNEIEKIISEITKKKTSITIYFCEIKL